MRLFDDIELNQNIAETEEKIVIAKKKEVEVKKVQKRRNFVNLDEVNLPVKIIHKTIDDCELKDIHSDIIKRVLCVIPSKHYIKEYHIHQYRKSNSDEIVKAYEYRGVLGKSMISEEVVSEIINNKVLNRLPLYRQEKSFVLEGINFSRQCMSNLIFQTYPAIKPILDSLDNYIKKADINRSDETELNIIEIRKNKPTTSKYTSYIWLFSTGNNYHPAYSNKLGPGRDRKVLLDYFGDKEKRYLMSDGYKAYQGIDNITNVYCLTHIRRNFFKLINKNTPKDAKSVRIVNLIDNIYHIEKEIKESKLTYSEIKEARIKRELPIVNELNEYIDTFKNREG